MQHADTHSLYPKQWRDQKPSQTHDDSCAMSRIDAFFCGNQSFSVMSSRLEDQWMWRMANQEREGLVNSELRRPSIDPSLQHLFIHLKSFCSKWALEKSRLFVPFITFVTRPQVYSSLHHYEFFGTITTIQTTDDLQYRQLQTNVPRLHSRSERHEQWWN